MAHLFLSPHMDDAVLSCGGLIYQLTQAGEAVTVISVMAGDVPPDVAISPFIEEHFRRWKLWPDPPSVRWGPICASVISRMRCTGPMDRVCRCVPIW
jgi:hypothetical protein